MYSDPSPASIMHQTAGQRGISQERSFGALWRARPGHVEKRANAMAVQPCQQLSLGKLKVCVTGRETTSCCFSLLADSSSEHGFIRFHRSMSEVGVWRGTVGVQ